MMTTNWKKTVVCLFLTALLFLAGCSDKEPDPSTVSGHYGGTLGSVTPELLVDGTIFRWTGLAVELTGTETPYGKVAFPGVENTALPSGYRAYGPISSVTSESPTQDRQMMADFDASGTIYISDATPEAVYVLLSTSWFKNDYVRFISAELYDGYSIAWQGRRYKLSLGIEPTEAVEHLPKNCTLVGRLHFIGQDMIPQTDLETNCSHDSYFYALEGRDVYFDPGDPDFLYVYERQHWAQGQYDAYLKCPLWQDGK